MPARPSSFSNDAPTAQTYAPSLPDALPIARLTYPSRTDVTRRADVAVIAGGGVVRVMAARPRTIPRSARVVRADVPVVAAVRRVDAPRGRDTRIVRTGVPVVAAVRRVGASAG